MVTSTTRGLILAAAAIGGLAAGASLDRSIVQLRAWRRVGPQAWASYSRQADLRSGLVWYPPLGLGSLILNTAAAVAVARDRAAPRSVAGPAYAAALLTVVHMLATAGAAPNMLRVRQVEARPEALQKALEGFTRWQALRATVDALLFAANLWSLLAISKRQR